jgi:hypothetical protein
MEAARVLHFGDDASHRLQVLRSEGYAVNSCVSLQEMISRLPVPHSVFLCLWGWSWRHSKCALDFCLLNFEREHRVSDWVKAIEQVCEHGKVEVL